MKKTGMQQECTGVPQDPFISIKTNQVLKITTNEGNLVITTAGINLMQSLFSRLSYQVTIVKGSIYKIATSD